MKFLEMYLNEKEEKLKEKIDDIIYAIKQDMEKKDDMDVADELVTNHNIFLTDYLAQYDLIQEIKKDLFDFGRGE